MNLACIRKNKRGFTLMEVLVSTSIFVLVTLASLSIFSATLKASQETTALTRIQQETQFIMEVLAKKIRTSRVDYDYYKTNPINNTTGDNDLVLVDLQTDKYVFSLDKVNKKITVDVNDTGAKPIPTTSVDIDDLKFYINPTSNPFRLDEPPPSQPYVTVVMTVSSKKGRQTASLTVQQTIPQRSGLVE